jgi:hypothetical protein
LLADEILQLTCSCCCHGTHQTSQVALHEGLMAAVSGCDVQLQHQLLDWLLRPVHAKWSTQAWLGHLAGPAEFAAEYMQHEVQQGGAVVVGSR